MIRRVWNRLLEHEAINFVLTNRIPRRLATRAVARIARVEQSHVRRASMALWQLFAGDLHLEEAAQTHFRSVHECFVRRLKPGARPVDQAPGSLVSPCDGIVVGAGRIESGTLIQAKGRTYSVAELVANRALAERLREGAYVTLRLTSAMYHRFHAPCDCAVERVFFVPGDTWNVNPAALARVDRLYCRNTRVVVPARVLESGESIALVAVGAILVASVQLSFLPFALDEHYRGSTTIAATVALHKGDEIGFFQHGSTIVVLGTTGLILENGITVGRRVQAGQRLLRAGGIGHGPDR